MTPAPDPPNVTYDGKEYEIVREGLAEILNIKNDSQAGNTAKSQAQAVFYNPIQQFNRDLSVLAIRAFGEDLASIRRLRSEKKSLKQNGQRGNKRKRVPEGGPETNDAHEPAKKAANAGTLTEAIEAHQPTIEGQTRDSSTVSRDGNEPSRPGVETGLDLAPKAPKADLDWENRQAPKPVGDIFLQFNASPVMETLTHSFIDLQDS